MLTAHGQIVGMSTSSSPVMNISMHGSPLSETSVLAAISVQQPRRSIYHCYKTYNSISSHVYCCLSTNELEDLDMLVDLEETQSVRGNTARQGQASTTGMF